ncbi:hypothetical protein TEA_002032 [Camellia sinensis var. sinensis]|uniref:Disease resistance protein At4g27190-like leucine-rich repeats domain-containing protein n=1 Tax=Camellia sinensis var. sinensis TaxID=542762 RepID=A0A4S4D3E1_CAMSN|nr:hypothetical protein TEA_002032 [Camellia sinensis var. sinensis]
MEGWPTHMVKGRQKMRLELAAMRLAMRQQQRRKLGVGHVKSSHGGTKLSTGQQLKGEYWAGSQHTHEASSTFCFGVNLTSLQSLYVIAMDNLMEIWLGELQAKLRKMVVEMCHGLPNILFPSNLMKAMQSLEALEMWDWQSVEVAFGIEGLIVREGHQDILFPSLTVVSLWRLPKLAHVWKDNLSGIQGFENLTSLNIKGCGSLRYLFPSSISKLLVRLREIEVIECCVMEVIIDEEPKIDDEVATNILMFPQLNTLKLRDLPNLRSFCLQAYTFERSLLKTVGVINCPNMKALPSAFKNMQELQMSNVQKANFLTSTQHHLLDGR